ncbi:hypothetical protein FACS1894190_12580 [Spirochaetia bacterium]|nr:hypothetical protein FACS1894190_12580 [Spirochaetia bacterium]
MGQSQQPSWLKPLIMNKDTSAVQSTFGIDSSNRIKYSVANDRNVENARIDAGLFYAQQLAQELKQYVMTAASRRVDQGQVERLEEITSATKVTITGNERVTDFWQLIETTVDGKKTRTYEYYIVWTMPQSIWTQITRKYVNDVIGQLPDTATQKQIAVAYADIQSEADSKTKRSDAEFYQQLKLQEQAAKDAQKRAMATINQKTASNQSLSNVAQAQVQAEAAARYAAYQSGDAATAAAASTTAADFDWISALATGASVLQ